MKVVGFTFIRNAVKFEYPIVAAIQSILPLCNEVVVAVGNSEDQTLDLIRSIAPHKIRIIETIWDDNLRVGGKVLADETNKALAAISTDAHWCVYIQGDEVLHEQDVPVLLSAMQRYVDDKAVEGLLFHYKHFYGSYHYIGDSRKWYRKEIRIIKNNLNIQSWGDAQGFKKNGQKLKVAQVPASVYHYGWVKNPFFQKQKQKYFNKLWHSDDWVKKNVTETDQYNYFEIDSLVPFVGTHPTYIAEKVKQQDWEFKFDINRKKFTFKEAFLYYFEKWTGYRLFEYKNYIIVKYYK